MASQSETGHSKNLANLKLLKDLLSQIGADYNPINNQLAVSSFTTLITKCETDYDNWIDKLKADKRNRGADVAILVTQVFPKDMERFGEKEGVWICNFNEVGSVAHLLRNGIIKINELQKSQENKGDKMQMLYDYLTGNEFRGQMEAIVEGFMAMKQGINRERIQMEKIWKEREKQLEKVLLSTSGMYGSVKGIAGASVGDIPLLDGTDEKLIEN